MSAHRLLVAGVASLVLAGSLIAPALAQTVPDTETLLKGDLTRQVLTTQTVDPTALGVAKDGRVVFAERTGRVKVWHQDGRLVTAGRVGVDSKAGQCDDCPGRDLDEGGLHGLLLAKDFDTSGHVYLYFSVPKSVNVAPVPAKHPDARGEQETEGLFRLSRFTMQGDRLLPESEQRLLENPAEWFHCCHYGGDLDWLPDGTLLLSVGDDTISSQSGGFSPRDERVGQEFNNAEKTSQNLADRRGKLLRIDVDDLDGDGSLVPRDNPFVGRADADPYVYALGFRSNYRFGVDDVTGTAYVGTVGPDGKTEDPNRGPASHEDLEVVPKGGGTNHGWPRCIADNKPYNDYDWSTGVAGPKLSCEGMTPAAVWYSYNPGTTSPFVQLGLGGVCNAIMGGSVYHRPASGALRLPERFDNQLLWLEWCRGAVLSTPVKPDGQLDTALDKVKVVATGLSSPTDSTFGPDGALYVAEYAARNYNSTSSKISRIVCTGCQPNPMDYGGAAVLPPTQLLSSPSLGQRPRSVHALAVLPGILLVGMVATGRRRRRFVA